MISARLVSTWAVLLLTLAQSELDFLQSHTRGDQHCLVGLLVQACEIRELFARAQLVASANARVIEAAEKLHTAAEP